MLQQMDFCVKYFPRVAIETCQHLSAEVIACRPVCCCAQCPSTCRLNHVQPSQKLIKEPGDPGSLRPLSYCHQGWPAKIIRAGLGVGCGLVGEEDTQVSQAAAGERASVGKESNLGSSSTYYVLPVVLGPCPFITLSNPCSNPVTWVLSFPFFSWGKMRPRGVKWIFLKLLR